MGLMHIIFTALGIFIVSAAVFLMVSYVLYKLRPNKKPYLEIKPVNQAAEPKKTYYTVPVYQNPVRRQEQRPAPRPKSYYKDVSRFEILNVQKPIYMQNAEPGNFKPSQGNHNNNIYEYYSNNYNDRGFRTVTP